MEAHKGDRIVVEGAKVGHSRREGEVLEAVSTPSSTYYRVRWVDGHETVFFPGPDARVERGAGR